MECKFVQHGIAIGYDQVIKPCCSWQVDSQWRATNHVSNTNLHNWHRSPQVIEIQKQLSQDQWPTQCNECSKFESAGRHDSMRLNGQQAYQRYQSDDITLEIRPGNTCNFACQTCWPEASSRVSQFYHQAGIIDIKDINSQKLESFDFLLPVANRIKNVVVLGGEPFYDKSCKEFLRWALDNLQADITMFTNGSSLDIDFLSRYSKKITLVFSIDAIGQASEYIRFGSVWNDVLQNYKLARTLSNLSIRVNITCSVYNYKHIPALVDFLIQDWPDVVTFGRPWDQHFLEPVIPNQFRPELIDLLSSTVNKLTQTNIEPGQKSNAINAVKDIIVNLQTQQWNPVLFDKWQAFAKQMDQVKHADASDYCDFLAGLIEYQPR